MDERQIRKIVKQMIDEEQSKSVHQSKIRPGTLRQTHIIGLVIYRGLVADLPSNGDREVQAFFAEDESKLYIWNRENDAWESVTLS